METVIKDGYATFGEVFANVPADQHGRDSRKLSPILISLYGISPPRAPRRFLYLAIALATSDMTFHVPASPSNTVFSPCSSIGGSPM